MSTRNEILENIVTNYIVVISGYCKIYQMNNFVAFMRKRVLTSDGRQDMLKQLTLIYKRATKADQLEISRLINLLEFYEDFID